MLFVSRAATNCRCAMRRRTETGWKPRSKSLDLYGGSWLSGDRARRWITKRESLRWTDSSLSDCSRVAGFQTTDAYSITGRTILQYSDWIFFFFILIETLSQLTSFASYSDLMQTGSLISFAYRQGTLAVDYI